jgi:hypothetical protein
MVDDSTAFEDLFLPGSEPLKSTNSCSKELIDILKRVHLDDSKAD